MELVRKNKLTRLKDLLFRIIDHNLFLLSSSISYYSAVAIAPFLMILLSLASLIGGEVQSKVTSQASNISPEFGHMVALIFQNVNEGVDIGSISGIIGIFVLLFTASLVFLQVRYGLDVIYGYHETKGPINIWNYILEKLFAMFVVFIAGIFLIISSSLPGVLRLVSPGQGYEFLAFVLNFLIYIVMFYGIHLFTPTLKPKKREAFKMAVLSSVFFIIGNTLLGVYFRYYATSSIYGAAATLLVFLIWTYYTSFTMFLTVEILLYLKKIKKIRS